jgi:hypothetical protein
MFKLQAAQMFKGEETAAQAFLTSDLNGSEWSASPPVHTGEEAGRRSGCGAENSDEDFYPLGCNSTYSFNEY